MLLNFDSFLIFSNSSVKMSSASYLGGVFNFKTSNLVGLLNSTFEEISSDESASLISLMESNKIVGIQLKMRNIKSSIRTGNFYFRNGNKIVFKTCEIEDIQNVLFFMHSKNILVFKNFNINNVINGLFLVDNLNIIYMNQGTIKNYSTSQELFYGGNDNQVFISNIEVIERINRNLGWIFHVLENNVMRFCESNFTLLKSIGLLSAESMSKILIKDIKIDVGLIGEVLIKVINSNIWIEILSIKNEMRSKIKSYHYFY